MQGQAWMGAGIAVLIAVASGYADHRRKRRRDSDRVGLMPWPLIQVLALIAALALASIAMNMA